MTEPKRQYRPQPKAGAQLADAIPTRAVKKGLFHNPSFWLYPMLLGAVVFDMQIFSSSPLLAAIGGCVFITAGLGLLISLYLKPVPVTLSNGHSVNRPRSRLFLALFFLLPMVAISLKITRFDLALVLKRIQHLMGILEKIVQPDLNYFSKVWPPLVDTLKMSLLGSAVGSLLSLPFAVLASANITRNPFLKGASRLFINIIRTLPTLIIASVCALVFGLGTFAGSLAIMLFTFGVVSKMLYESIETIDMGPYQALESMGATRYQAFMSACMPQILPTYLSHSLYSFEMNIRAASILGYVGAGGLGILISERIGWRDYQSLGTVLIALFATVLLIDSLSGFFRRKLS